ncbi:hypothetical protein TSUD_141300 [Trifolium subterraneum]|uniref:Uncharacterized protein n=1 Tax=Trifolium subterraneum TaxID=3900 RepID=A0A2Z6PB30_TRISU|nr:hypothetical protein TSUD_141300 [Trifolium subterraneum]
MNKVVFVMVNSKLGKKKTKRKSASYEIEEINSEDEGEEWIEDVEDEEDEEDEGDDISLDVGQDVSIGDVLGDDLELPPIDEEDDDAVEAKLDVKFDDVADIDGGKENLPLKVRVLRLWKTAAFLNPCESSSLDMVLVEEKLAIQYSYTDCDCDSVFLLRLRLKNSYTDCAIAIAIMLL